VKKVLYLLGQLDDRDVEWMIQTGKKERLRPGTTIIEEGKSLQALYIVLDGMLGVATHAAGDRLIARVGVGEVVGELSFVDARPPSATVRALTAAIVLTLARTDIQARLDQDLGFAARFYRSIAMFLSDRLRRKTSELGAGQENDQSPEDSEVDELDPNVLDNIHLAGARFHQVLQRLLAG
jgi:CRP-like cAMP-binding protein